MIYVHTWTEIDLDYFTGSYKGGRRIWLHDEPLTCTIWGTSSNQISEAFWLGLEAADID
jgi:hypothetical protein